MPETWYFLESGRGEAAENMAWDEALLESSVRLGHPVLRFYGWREPAATFGYSQRYRDVAQWTPLRPLIRRPTGGGLVPHDADWTYSLVFPPGHPWYELKATESYQRVHEWIRLAFATLDLATQLAPSCQKDVAGQCFIGAERFDLLWKGRKLAGAAQRRNRLGLLIQGSVQPSRLSVDRRAWESAMRETATGHWKISWQALKTDEPLLRQAGELAGRKYAQPSYHEQR